MKKILLLAMVLGLLVSGCAYKGWVRNDGAEVTYSNFMADHRQCYFSNQIKPGLQVIPFFGGFYQLAVQQEQTRRYEKCLEEKGYYKK